MAEIIQHKDIVPESCLGKRFDQTIAEMFPEYSRSRLKEWILAGHVKVNGDVLTKAREKMYGGETISIETQVEAEERFKSQNIPEGESYQSETQWLVGASYILSRNFSIQGNYNNKYGWGGGLLIRF